MVRGPFDLDPKPHLLGSPCRSSPSPAAADFFGRQINRVFSFALIGPARLHPRQEAGSAFAVCGSRRTFTVADAELFAKSFSYDVVETVASLVTPTLSIWVVNDT